MSTQGPETDKPKPKVFVFTNGGSPLGVYGAAVAEDGTVLPASHCSSSEDWLRRDMGADGHCTWKHDVYGAHYAGGFEVEWVANPPAHPTLGPILQRLNAEASSSEAAA